MNPSASGDVGGPSPGSGARWLARNSPVGSTILNRNVTTRVCPVPSDNIANSQNVPASEETAPTSQPRHRTVLRPRSGWQALDLRELWRFRDLLWILAQRDIQVRYKQTALGVLWAIIQPLAMVVIFAALFGELLGVADKVPEVDGRAVPYPVFLYAGQLPWIFFAATVSAGGLSLVTEADMLRKIYFPRLFFPLAAAGAPLVDYCLGFIIFCAVLMWYSVSLSWSVLLVPLLLLSTAIAALGTATLLAAVTVKYRDFKHVLPFMLQIWFFLTPVIYPISLLSEPYRWALYLNPMFGPIEGFRAVFVGTELNLTGWLISTTVAAVVLFVAVAYFNRVERLFADIA